MFCRRFSSCQIFRSQQDHFKPAMEFDSEHAEHIKNTYATLIHGTLEISYVNQKQSEQLKIDRQNDVNFELEATVG